MAVADLHTKINLQYSSQLSYVSNQLSYSRRFSLRLLPQSHNSRICCSVTSKEVQAPVAVNTEDLKKKPDCYGVFCLTYDLMAKNVTSMDTMNLHDGETKNSFCDEEFKEDHLMDQVSNL